MQPSLDHPERSAEFFKIAERFGIPLDGKTPGQISGQMFQQFCAEYLEWSKHRDAALRRYLANTPKLFRCYLPFTERVYALASEVVWYLDEVIVRDPLRAGVEAVLAEPTPEKARDAFRTMRMLGRLKGVIDSGYMLLSSEKESSSISDTAEGVSKLIDLPNVRSALDHAVEFGADKRPSSTGQEWIVFEARLDSAFFMGWHIPKPVTGEQGPGIVIGEKLPATTPETLASLLNGDPWESVRKLYPAEVAQTLRAAELAAEMGAAALFDRSVDDVILAAADSLPKDRVNTALAGSVKLVLPYLAGVPQERLLDLREAIPDSFREFRGKVNDIVLQAMKDEPDHGILAAQGRIETELSSGIHKLETEIAAVSLKTRLHGYGAIVPSVGALIGSMVGIGNLAVLATTSAVGVGYAIKAAAESAKDRKLATVNPFYFVWRATR